MVRVRLSYPEFKKFAKDVSRFKAHLHRALKGHHNAVIELPGQVTLQLTVEKARYFGRRASRDTPANARCPPAAESAKCQAQRALQSESVREAFRAKFPGDTMDKALAALCDMIEEKPTLQQQPHIGIQNGKKTRLVALLKKRQPQPAARALDALWACLMYTQKPLNLEFPDYERRCAYFTRIRELLEHTPPRLADIEEFANLYERVHGGDDP